MDVLMHARQASTLDFLESYKILIDGIIRWLSLSEKLDQNGRRFTVKSLEGFLKKENKWSCFRGCIYSLLSDRSLLTQEQWNRICDEFKGIFELQSLPDTAHQYLSYSESTPPDEDTDSTDMENMISLPGNIIRHPDGFDIHLSTIHGVKGETHDATLILETKNRSYDLNQLINRIAAEDDTKITQKTKLKFSRQLYVAASRPRHFLCIAMHANRINDEQKQALTNLGWKIIPLSQARGAA
jgi:DNA helicase-2/ATP-dependent DNA helicase PcrA